MKKYYNLFTSKISLFTLLAVIGLVIIILLDIKDNYFSSHDLLVELHGLIYDLFVFGIVLTIYETNKNKKQEKERLEKERNEKIDRYKEEINDFRFWHSEEAKFRITGLVKRLINLKVKNLNLKHCYLENANGLTSNEEMKMWDFSGANLNNTLWMMNNCTNSRFYLTKLFQSSFRSVNLKNCKLDSANLFETQFIECDFTNVSLDSAVVHTKSWFREMKSNKNIGIEELENIYNINEIPKIKSEIQGYKIIRK